jgi:diacylglycerol kinase (ATP)
MSAVTAPQPSPPQQRQRLPFGAPFLIADPPAARRDLTLLRRALAASGVVAEAAVARPVERAGAIAARALEEGHRLLVAVGSDRLAHALLRVLVDPGGPRWPDAVLGLAGLGRQDLSATFGLPDDPGKLAPFLLGPNLFIADVGRVRWRGPDGTDRVGVFANTAELGYPAEVSARAPAGGVRGTVGMVPRWGRGVRGTVGMVPRWGGAVRVGRLAAALGGLAATRSTPARLEVDHTAVDLRLAGLVVANGQFSMGRMKVAPRALPDDGRLSVIAFQGEPLGIYARSRDLYYGLHVPHPSIREYQSRRVAVDTAEPLALVLDGWRAAGGPPVSVDVMERALRVKV